MIADDLVIAKIPSFSTIATSDGCNLPQEHVKKTNWPSITAQETNLNSIEHSNSAGWGDVSGEERGKLSTNQQDLWPFSYCSSSNWLCIRAHQ